MANVLKNLSEEQKTTLLQFSVERVINCSMDIVQKVIDNNKLFRDIIDQMEINIEDWEIPKPIIVAIFWNARDEIHRERKNN